MNIIIVGDGKVGAALAEQLSTAGHDITIVDSNTQVLRETSERLDVITVNGNGASMAILREAGADHADLLIAATSRDELNLLTCLTARKLGSQHTIARIRNPEYTDQLIAMQEELGLSMTVNPEHASAQEAYRLLQFPTFLKRESFAKGRVEIVALPVDSGSRLENISLVQLYQIVRVKVLVCAVEREDGVHIPNGAFKLRAGDTIYVTAGIQDLAKLVKNLGLVEFKVRNVLIIGGSRIAFYLAKRCLESGIAVKIIEQDHQRCLELAEQLPKARIIEGDASRQELLAAERLKAHDAVVTLTGMDEENLILSLYAKYHGVPKVITKINHLEFMEVFRKLGIGSIISPKGLSCAHIVRYVRAMSSASGQDSVLTLHPIVDGQVEALEFQLGPETRHCGEPLKDIALKKGILIACITRRGRTILPKGDTEFYPQDTVVIVTKSERAIDDFDDIFAD